MLSDLATETHWDKGVEQQAEVGAWIMKNPAGETVLVHWPPLAGLVPNICLSTYDQNDLDALTKQGQLWRISNDGSGIPSPIPSYPVNKCVGNQK